VVRAHGLCKGYGGPPVFEDVDFDLGRGERLLVLGLNGAGKTSLLRILAGETTADLGFFDYGHNVDRRVLRPGARQPAHRRQPARQHPRRGAAGHRAHRDAVARAARHDGPVGREGVPGGGHPVGRREDQARAGDAHGRPQQPCCSSTSRRTTSIPGSRQAVADSLGSWKGSIIFVSHDTEFVEQLAPTKVLLMPDGDVDYFSEDWLDLVSLA
jgi:ATPase subunit of ABC transporter with duplicated ATPase domains